MEEFDAEMKELEERQRSLSGVLDSIKLQASSVMAFTAQWKELEEYFELTRTELRTRLEEMEERVKLVAEVEARAAGVKLETERKEKELREMEEAVEKKRREVEEGESELSSVKLLMEEFKKELRVNESEYLKRSRKLNWVEKRVEEKVIEVEVEERRLGEIRKMIEVKREELEECESELETKEERLRLVEISIGNCDRILELKEKLISVVESKGKDFGLLEKSMEEWSTLEGCVAKIERKKGEVDRKIEELSLVHDNKFTDEVELKERQMDSLLEFEKNLVQEGYQGSEFSRDGRGLQQFVHEHLKRNDIVGSKVTAILEESSDPAKLVLDAMQGFYPEEGELHFDLRFRRRGCCLLLKELKRISPQISPHVRQEAIELAADWKAKMTVASDNGVEVLGFLRLVFAYDLASIYDAKELKILLSSVSLDKQSADIGQALGIASSASPHSPLEPAELVLEWMQTEFSEYWTKAEVCLGANSISTCIFVLEKLMREVPHVKPHLEEDAMKLASQWKAKMRVDVENAREILGYLHFIAAYDLVYTLGVDEIVKHLGMISQNKEALEFCKTLPYADKIPGEFINCLVERKQLMDAIGFICSFKLTKKFSPAPLLKEYVEEKMKCCRDDFRNEKTNDGKVKVVNMHITDLRAVIHLIKDWNLESEYPSSDVEMKITELENVQESWREAQMKIVNAEQKKRNQT